ncbi:MAG: histidinol dehydrogenase, partial [Deltaproteobacteria bacterium]
MIRILTFSEPGFEQAFGRIVNRAEAMPEGVEQIVADIIADVRRRGDAALKELTLRFDRLDLDQVGLEVSPEEVDAACARVD